MKTETDRDQPAIEWERGQFEDAGDHMAYCHANGESEDGRKWIGTWEEVDGDFSEITNIEEE